MRTFVILLTALFLVACEDSHHEQPKPIPKVEQNEQKPTDIQKTDSTPVPTQPQTEKTSSSSLGEHLAAAAVTGAVGGAAAGASSAATHHALNSWKEKREAKRRLRRMQQHRAHRNAIRRR